MEEKHNCCYGCLCRSDERPLNNYCIQEGSLRSILQVDAVSLCYLCRRMAQKAETFIQNVQSNQILLENFENALDSTFQNVKTHIQPIINLECVKLDSLEFTLNQYVEQSVVVCGSRKDDSNVKIEVKQEDGIVNDDFDGDDDAFQDQYYKEETCELKELLKAEIQLEDEIDPNILNNSLKKVIKSKRKNVKSTGSLVECIEKINLTIQQCLNERERQSQDEKYVNSTYKCVDCIKGFEFKPSFDAHMEKHCESNGDYECDICKQRMDTNERLTRHKQNHIVRYQCTQCGVIQRSRRLVAAHYNDAHHSMAQCTPYCQYSCPHCYKTYERKESLKRHLAYVHNNYERVICAHCHKNYRNKDVLKAHLLRKHPEEVAGVEYSRKHLCKECGKGFRALSQLKIHSVTHSHSRDFYCVECDKSFKSHLTLRQHYKTSLSHVSYKELPLSCEYCEKRFAIKRDLERHLNRKHLNIKPYQCDKCDKGYVNSWSLSEHKRFVHEGFKRPMKFPCPMCDKVFNRNQILKSHIRTHTGERPYKCGLCEEQFSQPGVLATHVRLIHLSLTRDGRPKQHK